MKNIIKQELRIGLKAFLFWTLGLCVLIIGGMAKFLAFKESVGGDIMVLLDQFPKLFLAMFGMANLDIQSLAGFYGVLENYVIICSAIFSVHLGANAVSREAVDKTYEFIFTKPCTRSYILSAKLLGSVIFLGAFCLLNGVFSFLALQIYGIENTISVTIILYVLSSFVIGFVFLSLAAMHSALFKRSERGATAGNVFFLVAYILSVLFDLLEESNFIKVFTPLRYFEAADLIAGQFDIMFLGISTALCVIFFAVTYIFFQKRDLSAA